MQPFAVNEYCVWKFGPVDALLKVLTCLFPFFVCVCLSPDSDHTTSWDDARGLCQKDTQESHKRNSRRACGDGNHGKNGLFHTELGPHYSKYKNEYTTMT